MPLDPLRVKRVFLAVLDQKSPEARPARLDRERGADEALRARVEATLAALDRPDADFGMTRGAAGDLPPEATAAADFILGATAAVPSGVTVGFSEAEAPRPDPPRPVPTPASLVGTVIAGRYKVRQALGEGGMGTVYLAEQVAPVSRQVAPKLIRAGMDSRTVLARFESERQALAIMDHPHIARVLDAVSTESGHPPSSSWSWSAASR